MRLSRVVLAALIGIAGPLVLMGASFINSNVAVCDPGTPTNCLKPASDGSFIVTSTITPTTYAATAALASNLVAKASAGSLYSFHVSADSTLSAAAWWLMIYDAATAPADGAVTPAKCYAMPPGATAFSGAFPSPVTFSTGIVLGVSTTGCFTKTASVHAFIGGDYK